MKVLYVCSGNIYRSLLAEAVTSKLRPDMESRSRGTSPGDQVRPEVREVMREEDLLARVDLESREVDRESVEWADRIVAMKEEHRNYLEENFDLDESVIDVWDVDDVNPEMISSGEDIRPEIRVTLGKLREKVESYPANGD